MSIVAPVLSSRGGLQPRHASVLLGKMCHEMLEFFCRAPHKAPRARLSWPWELEVHGTKISPWVLHMYDDIDVPLGVVTQDIVGVQVAVDKDGLVNTMTVSRVERSSGAGLQVAESIDEENVWAYV
ncbi:hypothetical protein FISHEDRAFT_62905 [Fistulina hepatica ATCC 64428]|uniref:Uncharacterized protein n=1 Tax=Fistulina hepatica ATCC 64428 TaxID=1128425 RepID=A0A0D6ZZY8_9AGAR|nr:hypothetical protein FISHEDRAFT_62905 [Fistulina hepatica ATCC 64428]